MSQYRNIHTRYDEHQFEFFIPIAPIGVNHMFRSTEKGRRYKTATTRRWEDAIIASLMEYSGACQKIAELFNEKRDLLEVSYIWYIPVEKAITKLGYVSKKTGDTDNFIKPIQDIIFNACQLDDCYIWRYKNILRIPNEDPGIWCGINIVPISEIEHYSKFCK